MDNIKHSQPEYFDFPKSDSGGTAHNLKVFDNKYIIENQFRDMVFEEIIPYLDIIIEDLFGNYVI